jgi:D-amino-acid dehydrogenase
VGQGNATNVFYNTGHGHLGWTLSAVTADTVAQVVLDNATGRAAARAATVASPQVTAVARPPSAL